MIKNNSQLLKIASVIIPVMGRIEYVRQALDSIYLQNLDSNYVVEIILVEEKNYGENISMQLKKEYPDVCYLINNGKEGPGGSRQTGLKVAKGKFIFFLDSDDQMMPNFIKTMINNLEQDQKSIAAICFSKPYFVHGFKLKTKIRLYPLIMIRDCSLIIGYLFNQKHIWPQSFYLCQISHMVFKSLIKDQTFNYDYLRGGEDWDFIVQSLEKGTIKIVPKRLLLFRYSIGSSTFNKTNLELKWQAYSLLVSRLQKRYRQGIFYLLFLWYIDIFKKKKT